MHNATESPQVVQVCQVAANLTVVPNYAEFSPIAPISPISWHWCHLLNQIDHTKWWIVHSKNKHRIWAQYTSTGCSCDHYHTKAAALDTYRNWLCNQLTSRASGLQEFEEQVGQSQVQFAGCWLRKCFRIGCWSTIFMFQNTVQKQYLPQKQKQCNLEKNCSTKFVRRQARTHAFRSVPRAPTTQYI